MGATFVLIAASFGAAAPSFAGEAPDTTVEALVDLNPGTTEAQLLAEASELASALGTTPEAILEQQLAEAEESAAAAAGGFAAKSSSSGGGGTVTLGSATRKGDIFISPSSTLFIEHGHTGIYYTTATIVEAPGTGSKSRSASASSIKVGKGAVKQYVSTTQANRNKAANYAYNSMRGKPYNANFANNRYVPASSYNCSQLVWGAYKQTTSIDLDSNGGLGVYPYNIKDSNKTVTYKTL
ncbi:MAG: YiiX/YebB-like N1pC/P60 family cysteine hydrolase [Microbacterium sp.]